MNTLLKKEMRLSALLLTYLFIGFGVMTLVPGYPILCGAFFITLGIFQSFQSAREANDIVFSALLPIAKRDVVKGKYQFTAFIELAGFAVMAVLALVRMTVLADAVIYRQNALMNANLFFLGCVLLIFGLFNAIFIAGFFKTSYKFAKPFVTFIIVAISVICIAETAHHIPGLETLNAFGFEHLPVQLGLLTAGVVCYIGLTVFALASSAASFENIDL